MTRTTTTSTTTTTTGDLLLDIRTAGTDGTGPDGAGPTSLSGGPTLSDHLADTGPCGPFLRPQRILVAGDDVTSLALLVDAVSAPQREVHSTSSDDLALELALQLHFDLVVLHLDRPGAGGIEVSHCIRTCHELAQPTIVIVSRPVDEESWASASHCGADRVLAETSDVLDLTRALDDVLR